MQIYDLPVELTTTIVSFLEIDEIGKLSFVSWVFKEIAESQAVWFDLGRKFNVKGLELADIKNKIKKNASIIAKTYSFFLAQFPELQKKKTLHEKYTQISAHLNSFYSSSSDAIINYLKETNAVALEYYPKTTSHENEIDQHNEIIKVLRQSVEKDIKSIGILRLPAHGIGHSPYMVSLFIEAGGIPTEALLNLAKKSFAYLVPSIEAARKLRDN